jgi:hypothetical protein
VLTFPKKNYNPTATSTRNQYELKPLLNNVILALNPNKIMQLTNFKKSSKPCRINAICEEFSKKLNPHYKLLLPQNCHLFTQINLFQVTGA